jgi:predicted permease
MSVFLFILSNNIIPIFTLILFGYFLSKKFDLNIYTLTKLNFYIFMPCFTFTNLYTTEISKEMTKVLLVAILIILINILIAFFVSKIRGYDEGMKNAFANSILFYNTGNIGIPLITLVFSSNPFIINGETPYLTIALTAQIVILVVQDVATNTFGFLNAARANTHWKESLINVLKMPTIYVIPIAFILKTTSYDIESVPVWPAFKYASNALVPIALITLGVQLSKTALKFNNKEVYLSTAIRLLGGPLLALIFIHLMNIDGIIAQVLMISTSVPTAVNTALIAVEYDNHPEFASQSVMISTLLGSVSLVFIIYAANIMFPIVN